jgi:transposase
MARIEKKTKRYPSDLTDEEWSAVEPFMPKAGTTAAHGGRTCVRY